MKTDQEVIELAEKIQKLGLEEIQDGLRDINNEVSGVIKEFHD